MSVRELVLLSGWAMPAAMLAPLQAALAGKFRVTLVDLPYSATLAGMARQVLAEAPPQAAWFGWSLGGMVAAQAALLAPQRVTALAVLATNPAFVARDDWPHAMPGDVFAAFSGLFAVDPHAAIARFQALQCRGALSAREDLRRVRAGTDAVGAVDARALRSGLDVLRDGDLRAGIAELACPALWMFGEHDALVPVAVAADVTRIAPGARVTILPGASHASALVSCGRVVDALESFLVEHA